MEDDKYIERLMDDFVYAMIPWGGSDIRACVITANEIGLSMNELADIIIEGINDYGVDLEDADINAILNNNYIINKASNELEELISYDLREEDIYFYENYIDCPLQYHSEQADTIVELLKRNEVAYEDLNKCTQYVLSEMGVEPWK